MKIGVDLDGVLYEFDKTARYMLREYRGYRHTTHGLHEESTHWDYISERVRPEDWRWLWREGVQLGLFRYGHVVAGGIIGLKGLLDAGHKLVVITHRPTEAIPDTLEWLAYQRIPFSEIHILSDKEPKTNVDAAVLIDDKPENCYQWMAAGRRALLFNRAWNQSCRSIKRVYGWEDALNVIRSEA